MNADDLTRRADEVLERIKTVHLEEYIRAANDMADLIRDLQADRERLRKDAERYHQARWQLADYGTYSDEQAAENAVDAAITAEQKGGTK